MNATIHENYSSPAMKKTMGAALMAAHTDAPLLLLGETGSGKNYHARFIHDHSPRSGDPFAVIHCAELSENLIESELFGYEKSAFTGALSEKKGKIELAEGGTLVLDEIGEFSVRLQSKLLTMLDTQNFYRVGGVKEIRVGARIIAATNRDVVAEIRQGTFRADLFYRLEALSICLPPLRERKEDVPELVRSFLQLLGSELKIWPIPQLNRQGMQAAMNYGWPGDVRELRNLLLRSLTLSEGEVEPMNAHFVEEILKRSRQVPELDPGSSHQDAPPIIEELVRQAAGKRIRNPSAEQKRRLLEECVVQGSMKQAEISKRLGVSPSTACKWLKSIAGAVPESQETPLSDETPITGQLPN